MNEARFEGADELPPYEVVCLDMDPRGEATGHEHVTVVETRDADGGRTRWTSVQVISAIRDGARFVVAEDAQGHEILLIPGLCPKCPYANLRVDPPGSRPVRCD